MNKFVKKYKNIMGDLILKSFPELNLKIFIWEVDKNKYFGLSSGFPYFLGYIKVDKRVRFASKKEVIGLIAHELCHFSRFKKMNFLEKIRVGVSYNLTKKGKMKEEHKVNELVVRKGYGKEIYEFLKFSERVRGRNEIYHSAEEIKKYAKQIGRWD